MSPAAPEPLAGVLPEVLGGVRGVVFDIDDTVTRRGQLELEAFEAMTRLASAGIRLIAVTGRPLGWADVVAQMWPVEAAVGENGAGWAWRDGPAVRVGYFDDEHTRRSQAELLLRVRDRVAREMPHVRVAGDQRLRRCDLAFDVGETVELPGEEVDRLTALIHGEGARSTVSSVHAHAVAGSWDKARGVVRAAREALGLDLDAGRAPWLFIGDSGNDEAAFAHFPLSVGVANVADHLTRLRQPPRYVTRGDRGRGFREMADLVLAHRSG